MNWRKKVAEVHAADRKLEQKANIRRSEPQSLTPADIRAIELQKAPWLARRGRI